MHEALSWIPSTNCSPLRHQWVAQVAPNTAEPKHQAVWPCWLSIARRESQGPGNFGARDKAWGGSGVKVSFKATCEPVSGAPDPSMNQLPCRATPEGHVQPYLCPVWEEDGAGQVACDAAEHEDDGDAVPAGQLFQVPQDGHLEDHRNQAVYHAGRDMAVALLSQLAPPSPLGMCQRVLVGHLPCMEEQRQPEAVELVGDLRVEEGQ